MQIAEQNFVNLPNFLTLMRLAGLAPVVYCLRSGRPVTAAVLFVLLMLSDCIDGWIARRLGQETALGLYLDPVVDKIVILTLFYELANEQLIDILIAHLFLMRELLHSAVRSAGAARGRVIGANWMGKTKAALQTAVIALGLLLSSYDPGSLALRALNAAAWILLGLAWIFFAVFAWRNRKVLAQ